MDKEKTVDFLSKEVLGNPKATVTPLTNEQIYSKIALGKQYAKLNLENITLTVENLDYIYSRGLRLQTHTIAVIKDKITNVFVFKFF